MVWTILPAAVKLVSIHIQICHHYLWMPHTYLSTINYISKWSIYANNLDIPLTEETIERRRKQQQQPLVIRSPLENNQIVSDQVLFYSVCKIHTNTHTQTHKHWHTHTFTDTHTQRHTPAEDRILAHLIEQENYDFIRMVYASNV